MSAALKTFAIKPKKGGGPAAAATAWQPPPVGWFPKTLGEEVDALLAEWYGVQGLPIPAEEVGLGAVIDRQERERIAAELGAVAGVTAEAEAAKEAAKAEPPADETLEEKAARLRAAVGPKPEFGDKSYWSWASRKKAAENAERAAQGLPPLPSAKEKAAAVVAKKAAKAATK